MTRVAVVAAAQNARARLESVIARSSALELTVAARSIDAIARDPRLASSEVLLLHGAAADFAAHHLDMLPPIPIVAIVAESADDGAGARLLGIGFRGVLPHDATEEEIGAALDAAAAGLVVLPPEQVAEMIRSRAATTTPARVLPPRDGGRPPSLTAREQEILSMLAEGLPNKGIAARLGISDHTVKTHVEAVFEKLGASTRAEAVTRAVRLGLLLL